MVAHNVVRINGTLPGGEVWSVTPKFMGQPAVMTQYAQLEEWAELIGGFIEGLPSANPLRGLLSSAGAITSIRTEYRDASNALGQAAEYIFPSAVLGSGAANKVFQTSVVLSLRTGRPGRSYRGRIYWPALSASLNAQLRMTETTMTGILNEAITLFANIEGYADQVGNAVNLAVVSQTLDVSTRVTSVQVGDILDIQRRRRDSLQEFYVAGPMPNVE